MLKDNQYVYMEARKQKQADRQNIREALYLHKREEMLQIKRQREANENKKKEIQTKMYYDNKMRQRLIKEQEEISNLRKKEFMEAKIRQYRMDHERKMAEEEQSKQKKELEVLNMEKLEMELIRKLQHTQLLQKAAYEELESALANAPEEYERKYFQRLNGYGDIQEPNSRQSGRASFSGNKNGLDREDSLPKGYNDKNTRNKTPTPTLKIEGSHSSMFSKSDGRNDYLVKSSDELNSGTNTGSKERYDKFSEQKESVAQDNNSLKESLSNQEQGTGRISENQQSNRKDETSVNAEKGE